MRTEDVVDISHLVPLQPDGPQLLSHRYGHVHVSMSVCDSALLSQVASVTTTG